MPDTKCARCQKKILYFTAVLWIGPQGYRRYCLCDACLKKIKSSPSPQPSPVGRGGKKVHDASV